MRQSGKPLRPDSREDPFRTRQQFFNLTRFFLLPASLVKKFLGAFPILFEPLNDGRRQARLFELCRQRPQRNVVMRKLGGEFAKTFERRLQKNPSPHVMLQAP